MSDHALHPHTIRPPLRPGSVSEFLELLPYLLGFHPRDSLVLVALHRPRRRVGVTMRVDLRDARECGDVPASLSGLLRRDGAVEALAVVYSTDAVGSDPSSTLPDRPLVQRVGDSLTAAGLRLVDAIYVGDSRWWSYACRQPGCCPPEGRPLPAASGRTSPAVAAATYAGLVALPSREALERTLDPADQVPARAIEHARATVEGERALAMRRPGGVPKWCREAVGEIHTVVLSRHTGVLTEGRVARFVVMLADERVRDACCDWVEGTLGESALALWRQLARRAVPPYDVTPCALLAWSAWHAGAGPLARIAVGRALASDPACRLALLLEEALDRGVNPTTVRGRPRGRRRGRPGRPPAEEDAP